MTIIIPKSNYILYKSYKVNNFWGGDEWQKLGTFEFCVQGDNKWRNLALGQSIVNQVDGKSGRNRNGQVKPERLLIWLLQI